MANPCCSCGKSSFCISEVTDVRSNEQIQVLQCSSCGLVYGIDNSYYLGPLEDELSVISGKMDDIETKLMMLETANQRG